MGLSLRGTLSRPVTMSPTFPYSCIKTVINPTTPPHTHTHTTETTLRTCTDKELELTNLEPGKEFCIEVISNNTGNPSLPVSKLIFKTANNIPIAMITAVSAGTKFG